MCGVRAAYSSPLPNAMSQTDRKAKWGRGEASKDQDSTPRPGIHLTEGQNIYLKLRKGSQYTFSAFGWSVGKGWSVINNLEPRSRAQPAGCVSAGFRKPVQQAITRPIVNQ